MKISKVFAILMICSCVVSCAPIGVLSVTGVASAMAQPRSALPATGPLTYTLDDFDVPHRTNNDFFAPRGIWNSDASAVVTDAVHCDTSTDCYLGLTYDLSSAGAKGGYWEKFNYTYPYWNPVPRDLSGFTQFRFRVRGDKDSGFASQFQIEFIGSSFAAPRAQFNISGVTSDWQWETITLADAAAYDWTAMTQVSINLDGAALTQKTGQLYFDDLGLVARDTGESALDLIEHRSFLYFWENRHPTTGFVRDRASDPFYSRNVTSIAALGFELTAFGIGAQRGWITRLAAAQDTNQILRNLLSVPQGSGASGFSGYRGFFYHMLTIDTGVRDGDAELSSIDTALLMAGVLFARQYYTGSDDTEVAIRDQASQLYNRVEWDWMLRTAPLPADRTNQIYMGWKPELRDCSLSSGNDCYELPDLSSTGYFSGDVHGTATTWNYYTDEILLLNILAVASPSHPIPANTLTAWARQTGSYGGQPFIKSWSGQLFTYFIGQMWLDRQPVLRKDPAHVDWWLNSQQAILADRQFAVDHSGDCAAYSSLSWGISTSLGPPALPAADPYSYGMDALGIYGDHPVQPRGDSAALGIPDCTLAPYAVAGSAPFLDADPSVNQADQTLVNWLTTQPRLWGLYGFKDAFNLKSGWYAHDIISLDQGMILLGLENHRTAFVWNITRRDPLTGFWMNTYLPAVKK